MRNYRGYRFTLSACTLAVAATLAAAPARAFEFSSPSGELRGSFDTTVSLGASWRLQDLDPELVGITNGGTARSVNEDDGNLNYEKKDTISAAVKVTHDISLDYQNYGAFVRGTYFYDHAAAHKKDEFGPQAEDRLISDADLLDAYVHGAFDIAGRNLSLRLGRQVVSWGESTFILNGINVINAIDVRKLRVPGAELKEALVASPMVWASQGITRTTSVEALYIASWDKTDLDPRGSFFSTNDFVSEDGDKVYVGFGRRVDQHDPPGVFGVTPDAAGWAPRAADRDPDDSGQYGFALRQFLPWLNNTEIGLFYVNYHSRTPFITGTRGGLTAVTPVPGCSVFDLPTLLGGGGFPAACAAAAGRAGVYFLEYPEDIRMTGLSFNTSGPFGIALQGEFSYRPNQPVQLASTELLLAALGAANNITGNAAQAFAVPYGTELTGYRRLKMNQAQMTATKAFGPTLGADQFVVLGEVGFTYLDLPNDLLFNGPATHLPAPGSSTAASGGSAQPGGEGYATNNSWGYRLLARWDFENALGAASLSPRIVYAHDVHGVSPTFNQGAKAVTVGLSYNLRQVWTADVAYTGYWGGRTYAGTDPAGAPAGTTQSASYASSANPNKDRDFLSVSVSYAF
ncbi:MAG TPA: DUF1302 domain-containing protein [Acidiferrobacterales bacterium]